MHPPLREGCHPQSGPQARCRGAGEKSTDEVCALMMLTVSGRAQTQQKCAHSIPIESQMVQRSGGQDGAVEKAGVRFGWGGRPGMSDSAHIVGEGLTPSPAARDIMAEPEQGKGGSVYTPNSSV